MILVYTRILSVLCLSVSLVRALKKIHVEWPLVLVEGIEFHLSINPVVHDYG